MAEAGRAVIQPVVLSPRAMPKLVHAEIDALDVPADYILYNLSQCSTFPEVLVFFLKGKLRVRYLWQYQNLATIDTYFMINCRDGGTVPSGEKNETMVMAVASAMAEQQQQRMLKNSDDVDDEMRSSGGRINVPLRLNKFM